jgi:hypothetical protein
MEKQTMETQYEEAATRSSGMKESFDQVLEWLEGNGSRSMDASHWRKQPPTHRIYWAELFRTPVNVSGSAAWNAVIRLER